MGVFHVGGKVVALADQRQGFFKKGDIFTVLGIVKSICKCKVPCLDIGLKKDFHADNMCTACGETKVNRMSSIMYFHAAFFAPLEEDEISDTSVEEFLEKMEVAELVER